MYCKIFNMKVLAEINNENLTFNHRVYDNAKDKEFAMHSHNLYEFIYVFSGELEYVIENKKYIIKPDTLIIIKPYAYHYFTITSHYDYEKISVLTSSDNLPSILTNDKTAEVIFHPGEIIKNTFHKISYYYKAFNNNIFSDLLLNLIKEVSLNITLVTNNQTAIFSNLPSYVESALSYINDNLFDITDLEEIASHLYISKTYLISLFKKHLKIAPKQYINEKRLLYAKNLLLLGNRPTDIYEKCGFSTYTSFFRSYKKYFGVAPSET